jgi:hypothetical protein
MSVRDRRNAQTIEHYPMTAMRTTAPDLETARMAPDRRTILLGLAALAATPSRGLAASQDSWTLATQIVAGAHPANPTIVRLAVAAIEKEFGAATVRSLRDAVLARDAADIVEPFAEAPVEAAARRFVEIVYTGEFAPGNALAFDQALAWQVLSFTKAPGVCGPGFGWWTNPPTVR